MPVSRAGDEGFGVHQVAFEGFGDAIAVTGGEQVKQQASGDGEGDPK